MQLLLLLFTNTNNIYMQHISFLTTLKYIEIHRCRKKRKIKKMYIREILLLILGALFSQQFTWTFLSTVYQKHLVLKRKDIFFAAIACIILMYLFFVYLPLNNLAKGSSSKKSTKYTKYSSSSSSISASKRSHHRRNHTTS